MKYFTIPELTHSLRAQACGIDNTPPASAVPLMVELIDRVLDPIRERWQSPVYINSGYRCAELNKKVGGAANSYHTRGMAADITAKSVFYNTALYSEIRILHAKGLIPLTECYLERQGLYIHVAYDPSDVREKPFINKL